MSFSVAIDGPSGAGKSTIAKTAAAMCGMIYVDTGAMYRAIGLYFLKNEVDIRDRERCEAMLPDIDVSIDYEDGKQKVLLNGEDVSGYIRTQEVGEAASVTSAYPGVRAHLLELQRSLAKTRDVIMDGRDIGTTILPDAPLKIYLTAAAEVRGKRRYLELLEKGQEADLAEVIEEVKERDYRDSHREISPLRQAVDAVLLDTTEMTLEESEQAVIRLIRERREIGD